VDAIDRVGPTRRPPGRAAMRQSWRRLGFLHWELDGAALARRLAPGLSLDTFEGRAFVGLVPFTMQGVRPWWAPAPPGVSAFHEVNVRTYVHFEGRDPGVYFFSLDAASRVAVATARAWFKLPYHYARMRLDPRPEGLTAYASDRRWPAPVPAACRLLYGPRPAPPAPARPGTLEHFLAERYILYTSSRGRLLRGRVHHPPYPLQPGECPELDETLLAAAGLARPDGPPLVHYAAGVDVEVFGLTALGTPA
jgi:uncharacterized protein YqjF (DUF2071 family)